MTANRRIALNVVATYGRSLYAMVLGLFTARWALQALGQVDYGLYGVVGGLGEGARAAVKGAWLPAKTGARFEDLNFGIVAKLRRGLLSASPRKGRFVCEVYGASPA